MNLMKKDQETQAVESKKGNSYVTPAVDIYESDDQYTLYYDVPGVEKSDIDIKVEKNVLTLSAECSKNPAEGFTPLRREMNFAGFRRSFDLGTSVDSTKISAEYKNGSLKVTLPKREEQKTRQVKIAIA